MEKQLMPDEVKFIEFISMLSSSALFQMGKIANPMTGKVEKDLAAAKHTIDLLVLLKDKTKGNLTDNEKRILDESVSYLQLNYLDEQKQESQPKKEAVSSESSETPKEESKETQKEELGSSEDEKLNWEKHERKSYGSSEEK